ncbi:hypothetical protein FISHEDRAFT_48185 [Fistulina hepatica ATCC 64428]|uniref:DH domain-containing protein n=1 Tax=Fistulina hepatica ATCC 64428 TaxID=1128425 RepID=A0A0D7A649_9AGAR|nr:hypothetical protein FISHEDRAFT_48185 [Fistulina hepatica ATCC 64428]
MVHRPTDSRLLSSLLSHEKDYIKALTDVLNASLSSRASLSAFAAASPPPLSSLILSIASSLAPVDDALQRYALAVEEWREMLTQIKILEDSVANTLRDREILYGFF